MAQTEEQKLQAELLAELKGNDVKLSGDAAKTTKENIENDKGSSNYLGVGVHEVFIKSVELIKAKSGTLGMQFNVEGVEGTGRHTFWLSEAALPYTIEGVSRLVVHNTAEEKKAEARTFMSNIASAMELVTVAQKKLIEGVAFLSIRESKTQTYTNKNGETKASWETSLLSWKPKETAEQAVNKMVNEGEAVEIDASQIPF